MAGKAERKRKKQQTKNCTFFYSPVGMFWKKEDPLLKEDLDY